MIIGIVLLKNWEFSFWGKTPNSVFKEGQKNSCTEVFDEKIKIQPDIRVSGIIEQKSVSEKSQIIYLKKAQVCLDGEVYQIGKVKAFVNTQEQLWIGEGVRIHGKIEKIRSPGNPGEFDSQKYEACNHVFYLIKKGNIEELLPIKNFEEYLYRLREVFKRKLDVSAGRQAGIFSAMILGDKSLLDKDLKDMYQMSGIIHILAISGLHLSMIGMGVFHLLKYIGLGNGGAGVFAIILIYFYGIMTGGSVATFRAIIMMMLSIGGKILGRSYDLLTALSLSAVLILIDSPDQLWNSGFLLSFGAVLGMALLYPVFRQRLKWKKKAETVFLASVCVQMFTLPIQLYFYYEVSFIGIFLNLIVIPTVSCVIISGIAGMISGLFCPLVSRIVLYPGRIMLLLYEKLCRFSLKLPFGIWVCGRPKWWQICVYYVILISLLFGMRKNTVEKNADMCISNTGKLSVMWKNRRSIICYILPYICAVMVLGFSGRKCFSITCLDVGQGDGIVITTESGKVFLCDGGSSSLSSVGTYQILPYLKYMGYNNIDGIFVSHTDADHISGILEMMQAQEKKLSSVYIKKIYLPEWQNPPEEYNEIINLADRAKIKTVFLHSGEILRDSSVQIRILNPEKGTVPEDVNEAGMVLEIRRGEFKGILTGDIGTETEEKIWMQLSDCDFLKVGHHGSRNSTGEKFLDVVRPEIAFISCSERNTYGHPSPETLERLEKSGARIYITRDCGAITLTVSDQGIKVRARRDETS